MTVLETIIALGILASAAVIVAQTGTLAISERMRTEERLAAIETAANVLEAARARTWADLTPEWAAAQKVPEEVAERVPDARLSVTVAAEPDRPRVKRVTVELNWIDRGGKPALPVTLVALFSERSTGGGQ
jgi:type II secretory pathway pseudopilin PulG